MKIYDVIIIGAGMAGLAAASNIYSVNTNILILEARDRIGGRLWTESISDGLLYERGGELIHGTNNEIYKLVQELGIEILELKKPEEPSSLWQKFQFFLVWFVLRFNLYKKPKVDESVQDYLNRLQFIPHRIKDFADYASKDFETLDNISAVHALNRIRRQILSGEMYGDHDFLIKNGYTEIVHRLAHNLPIKFNQIVSTIRWSPDQVEVQTLNDTFIAKKIITTLPIPILKNMEFEPKLPLKKRAAIQAHVSGDIIKLIVSVPKQALKTDNEEGSIAHAALVPLWWRRNSDGPQNIVVGWITGPYARHYLEFPHEEALTIALNDLSAIFDINQIKPQDIIVQNWMIDPFSQGTYCYIKPGHGLNVIRDLQAPLEKTLYFAGTATSIESGTAHGAYESGLRAAKEVIRDMHQ